jgi:hypothetical protein
MEVIGHQAVRNQSNGWGRNESIQGLKKEGIVAIRKEDRLSVHTPVNDITEHPSFKCEFPAWHRYPPFELGLPEP